MATKRGKPLKSTAAAVEDLISALEGTAISGVEEIMYAQREEMIAEDSSLGRYGTARVKVGFLGRVFWVKAARIRLPPGGEKKYDVVPLAHALKPKRLDLSALVRAGVSVRKVAPLLNLIWPGGAPPGVSSSRVSKINAQHAAECLDTIRNRRDLKGEGIVEVMLDGTEMGKRTVLVAVGITLDGRKLALACAEDETENKDFVVRVVEDLLERGLDYRVVWQVDGGKALWEGIKEAYKNKGLFGTPLFAGLATHDAEAGLEVAPFPELTFPLIASCNTHHARKVLKPLRSLSKQLQKEIRKELYWAWRQDEAVDALDLLRKVEQKLEGLGRAAVAEAEQLKAQAQAAADEAFQLRAQRQASAAEAKQVEARLYDGRSKRRKTDANKFSRAATSMGEMLVETLTLTRLGVPWRTRKALRSTNFIESIIGVIDRESGRVTRWSTDAMRLLWSASSLVNGEPRWSRVADPPDLVDLLTLLAPEAYDPAAWVSRLPPTVTTKRLDVPTGDLGAARRMADEWLHGRDPPVCLGSEAALEWFGLKPGDQLTREQLALALQRREVSTGTPVRDAADEVPVLLWRLEASDPIKREWLEADQAGRAKIEQGLVVAAQSSLERLTRTGAPRRGIAAAAVLSVAEPPLPGGEPELAVEGVAFGRLDGRGKVKSPVTKKALEPVEGRWAADAARGALNNELGLVVSEREPARAPGHAVAPRPNSLVAHWSLLKKKRAEHIADLAAALRPEIAGKRDDWILAKRRWAGDPFGKLDPLSTTHRLQKELYALRTTLETAQRARDEEGTARTMKLIRAKLETIRNLPRNRNLREWMDTYEDRAAWVVALEEEARTRELELDWEVHAEFIERARRVRHKLLSEKGRGLDRRALAEFAELADWWAAWLPGKDEEWLKPRLAQAGEPLERFKSQVLLLESGDSAGLRTLVEKHQAAAAVWLALGGAVGALEREKAPAVIEPHAEPGPVARQSELGVSAGM